MTKTNDLSKKPPLRLPSPEAISAGRKAGAEREKRELRLTSVTWDALISQLRLVLPNKVAISVPYTEIAELKGSRKAQREQVVLRDDGRTLTWPELDVHISVMGLLVDLLGADRVRSVIASRNARTVSDARRKAAQANGKLGGRPKTKQDASPVQADA